MADFELLTGWRLRVAACLRRRPEADGEHSCLRPPGTASTSPSFSTDFMIRISISVEPCKPPASLISEVRCVAKLGILEVRNRPSCGQPVFEQDLYAYPEENTFSTIRTLLSIFESYGFEPIVRENGRLISAQHMRNMLQTSDETREQLRQLDDLGHS